MTGEPTSEVTTRLAARSGSRRASLEEAPTIDLLVDGADELDPSLDPIKGYGGALARGKMVAAASRRLVTWSAGEDGPRAWQSGKLPVEVLPFGHGFSRRRLVEEGLAPMLRRNVAAPPISGLT